eukprot:gb/GECG01003410.1/.p1 GENE.gb/GECG01003410.1/~~gb/GECG01003410.1/.p1  ORF type:complete len:320 (+),score=21.81 gb/GECG01003410.1/:1-960(+)
MMQDSEPNVVSKQRQKPKPTPNEVPRKVPKKPGFFASKGGLLLLIALGLLYVHTHGVHVWHWMIDTFGSFWASFAMAMVVPDIYFALVTGTYAMMDLVPPLHRWAVQYKTQPEEPSPTLKDYWHVALIVGRNMLLVEVPLSYLYALNMTRDESAIQGLPSVPKSVLLMVTFIVALDVIFFTTHRILHHPWVYKHFHWQHHSFSAPCAMASKYCSTMEHLFQNLLSVVGTGWILGTHPMLMGLWTCVATTSAACVHSGYDLLTVLPHPHFHDWHHEMVTENFGSIGLMDHIFGTDKRFREALVPEAEYYSKYHPQYMKQL